MVSAFDDDLALLGRTRSLFHADLQEHARALEECIGASRFLVVGGGGSVGRAVAREIFARGPRALHLVDINESALADAVRDLRSSIGYIEGDFRTFCVDCGDPEFDALIGEEGPYDYVLYLAALKHVRSDRDPYTLMRMLRVNVLDLVHTVERVVASNPRKFFSVSTDKASNPVNAMGASKSAMERFLHHRSGSMPVSKVRLANVAFSNGSLPASFRERLRRQQPIAAPRDVRRWFITETEAAQLCVMSLMFGDDGEIFFPKRGPAMETKTLAELATGFLASQGLTARECSSEDEARAMVDTCRGRGEWPCFFTVTDTSGEKVEEEFVAPDADVDLDRYRSIGVLRVVRESDPVGSPARGLDDLLLGIRQHLERGRWTRSELVALLRQAVPSYRPHDTGRFLDSKM